MKLENIDNKHHITIDAHALAKFEYILYSKYAYEFTAFFHAERREGDEFHLFDVFFPRQDNTATTTECDSDDIMALIEEGLDISMLAGHAHSHVNMNVFSSGTDKTDIHERAKDGLFNAAFIMNKKGEMFGHIVDMTTGHYYTEVDIFVTFPFTEEEYKQGLLDLIRQEDDLKEIAKIAGMSQGAYYDYAYGISDAEKAELDAIVKDRFEYKTYYSTHNKKKEEKNQVKPATTGTKVFLDSKEKDINSLSEYEAEAAHSVQQHNNFDWNNANEWEDYIMNQYDGSGYKASADLLAEDELAELNKFTDDELALWQEIKNKSTMELTDAEWTLWDKMYNLGGRFHD